MHLNARHAIGLLCGAAGTASAQQILFDNGPWQTGTVTQSGVAAPAGSLWSEVANDSGQTTIANTTLGFALGGQTRVADNFVVSGTSWGVQWVSIPLFSPGASLPTVTAATLRIWDGPPNAGGVVVYGDATTNRFAGSGFTNTYRCSNTVVPAECGGSATAPTQDHRVPVVMIWVNTNLPMGSYWIDYSIEGAEGVLPTTVPGTRQPGGAASNALRFNGAWSLLVDPGQGCDPTPLAQETAFFITGRPVPFGNCYANCDGSTMVPCLNVLDFVCFFNKFAVGDTHANCDGSTIPPILNVNDFTCFMGMYAASCVQPCMPPP